MVRIFYRSAKLGSYYFAKLGCMIFQRSVFRDVKVKHANDWLIDRLTTMYFADPNEPLLTSSNNIRKNVSRLTCIDAMDLDPFFNTHHFDQVSNIRRGMDMRYGWKAHEKRMQALQNMRHLISREGFTDDQKVKLYCVFWFVMQGNTLCDVTTYEGINARTTLSEADIEKLRNMIRHEDNLANNRLTWLSAFNGLFFAALGLAWSDVDKLFILVVAGMGTAISISTFYALYDGHIAIDRFLAAFREFASTWEYSRLYVAGLSISAREGLWPAIRFVRPRILIPVVLVVGWITIIIYVACYK